MKKLFLTMAISFSALLAYNITDTASAATDEDWYLQEDTVLRDPVTGQYSKDYSYLDTPENYELLAEIRDALTQPITIVKGKKIIQAELLNAEYEEKLFDFLIQVDPEFKVLNSANPSISLIKGNNDNVISIMGKTYDEKLISVLNKVNQSAMEAQLLALKGATPVEIAKAVSNSNTARDLGEQYAKEKNLSKTWDNAADALRHFSWNFMNSNDMGVNKARLFGDAHEIGLIAYNYFETDLTAARNCSYTLTCMYALAVNKANTDWNTAKKTLSDFNDTFDNSSVMDLLNNSQGRQAFQAGYSSYSTAFNTLLSKGSIIAWPSSINSTYRTTAYNGFK